MANEIRREARAFLEQGERDVRNARGNLGLEFARKREQLGIVRAAVEEGVDLL